MRQLCVCYLISTLLITLFVYVLLAGYLQNRRALNRLREEVDEIAHVILHEPPSGPQHAGQLKNLNEIVDGILKQRLSGIWDDLYTVKKQLKAIDCSAVGHPKKDDAIGRPREDRVNYASEHLGAKIENVVGEPLIGTSLIRTLLGLDYSCNAPINLLRSNMEPGSCFAFRNNKSDVTIKLGKEIFVETIELQHIPKALSPTGELSSAPKAFEVYGVKAPTCKGDMLGKFVYNNEGSSTQQYSIKSKEKLKYIRISFLTNHGHSEKTCVYRIAVFGRTK